MKHLPFPIKPHRRRIQNEAGGDTVEYIIVILAVVVIGGGRYEDRQQHQLMVRQGERCWR